MSKNLGKWIATDTITGGNVRFANEESFRARNAANTADLPLFKASSTDKLEFQTEPVYNGGAPTTPQSLVTQQFVQDLIAGLRDLKDAVRFSSDVLPAFTAAGSGVGKTLTADANGAFVQDGITGNVGDRFAYLGSSVDAGIYVLTDAGSAGTPWILTRATDADEDAEVTQGLAFDVVEGTARGRTRWLLTTDNITVDTTSLTFVEVPTANPQVQFKTEKFTLAALDISNGYVDLANEAEAQSILVYPVDGPVQETGVDYTTSVVSLVTRVTFAGDLASTLADGDTLVVKYAHF